MIPIDFPSIQVGITSANNGDTIMVLPGIYREHVKIDRSVTIIGSGNLTIIVGFGNDHTIKIPRGVTNVTLKNFKVVGSGKPSWAGIYIGGVNNTVEKVTVTNHGYGIFMWDSSGNSLKNNSLFGNICNLKIWGLSLSHFLHNIDSTNRVEGKKVYYWVNQRNKIVPKNAGYVALINCSKIFVKNLYIEKNFPGVLLAYTEDTIIRNVTFSMNECGIRLISSHDNFLINNKVLDSGNFGGIYLTACRNNTIANNTIKNNLASSLLGGITLESSTILSSVSAGNKICNNFISENSAGMVIFDSQNNSIINNKFLKNKKYGLFIKGSECYDNIIYENIFFKNYYGIWIDGSDNNYFFHNTFVNNTFCVGMNPKFLAENLWDGGYPTGGNYWKRHSVIDERAGAYQNESGSDGINDIPYLIDNRNVDRYPLIHPWNKIFTSLVLLVETNVFNDGGAKVFARLMDEYSNPIADAVIKFYIVENGSSRIICCSKTNTSGIAVLDFNFANIKKLQICAEYEGNDIYSPTTANTLLMLEKGFNKWILLIFATALALITLIFFNKRRKSESLISSKIINILFEFLKVDREI
jgi:parallel beta-helix repeat protein